MSEPPSDLHAFRQPGPRAPLFSILIPSWNNLEYLKLCVHSIRRHSRYPHQILIHVNDGSDGTLDWVRQQPDLGFHHSEANIGICYALNQLRSLASTEYIVYFNDDFYVCPDWDADLWNRIEAIGHTRFFLSATLIEPYATGNTCCLVQDFGRSVADFREQELLRRFRDLPWKDWSGATWPPNVVHRDTWDLVGGYSVEFSPGMYSDPDFSRKLWEAGIRLFQGVSASRVYHFVSKSTGRVSKNKGSKMFLMKWGLTAKTFTRYVLRRGEVFRGPLEDPRIPVLERWRNALKRIWLSASADR